MQTQSHCTLATFEVSSCQLLFSPCFASCPDASEKAASDLANEHALIPLYPTVYP